jgi:hypothetical protein
MTHLVSATRSAICRRLLVLTAACISGFAAGTIVPAALAAAPGVGDVYVYRLFSGYTKESHGQWRYRVDRLEAGNLNFSVTPETAGAGSARTEIYTSEGNGLRRLVESRGGQVEYEFAAPFPAYVFPLEPGKTWSLRVPARAANEQRERSVRVDGKVLGTERIRVPAGEFDTVKIRRLVWPGDGDDWYSETEIVEHEWYAPALGRPVRIETTSTYFDWRRSRVFMWAWGDWSVLELVEARKAKP